MPVDSMILEPMINPFKDMYNGCLAQNLSGEHIDNMASILKRMEDLGQEHSDIMVFMGQWTQENLAAEFSDQYSKALAGAAKQSSEGEYDDATLLNGSIKALKDTIIALQESYDKMMDDEKNYDHQGQLSKNLEFAKRYNSQGLNIDIDWKAAEKSESEDLSKAMTEKPAAFDSRVELEVLHNPARIIEPIQNLINLGEQEGMTFPKFLKIQIEKGLDKAMEGSVLAHEHYKDLLVGEKVKPTSPYSILIKQEQLELFERLGSLNKFGVPNHVELSLGNDAIERKYATDIVYWEDIIRRYESILSGIAHWARSYCKNAHYWLPWKGPGTTEQQAKINVQTTKDTQPGKTAIEMEQLERFHGISFFDIFKHPSFKWEVKQHRFDLSQIYLEFLIEEIYPVCKPLNHLPSELIPKLEQIHLQGRDVTPLMYKFNPQLHIPALNYRDYYDSKFGAGRYESKFYKIEEAYSKDPAWDLESFIYSN